MINETEDVQVTLQANLAEAARFLKLLDPQSDQFTFQTFDDEKKSKDETLTRIFNGTLDQHAATLRQLNAQGAGVFVTINKTDLRGRKAENVIAVRSFFVDTDGAPHKPILVAARDGEILPSCVVESSPGNFHIYWKAACDLAEFRTVQTALSNKFGTDKSVHDLPRVMRLAGFFHLKRKNGIYLNECGPYLVSIRAAGANPASHTPDEMIEGLGLAPLQVAAPSMAHNDALAASLKAPPPPETPGEVERVKSALETIPASCDRASWRNTVWSIASTGWQCAEMLARAWSMTAPDKYTEDEFNKVWRSFDKSGGLGLGTLFHYAEEAGWTPSISQSPALDQTQSTNWIKTINQSYAWIEANASIYRLEYADFIEPAKFKTQHDNQTVFVGTKSVGIGSAWLKHANRRQHRQLVIRPQEGLVTRDNCLNEWKGFAVESAPGNMSPFFELIERLVPDQDGRHYILSWLAHLLQHPEVKMYVALAFWSLEQGVGKNLLFECIVSIIGSTHATVIGQAELAASFNGWANRKIFVVGDEVSGTDRRPEADKLKGLVTGTAIYLNEKYQPAREATNLANFVFLSNHHDALFLDDRDRRFFVWEITADRLPVDVANKYVGWRDTGGLSALLHYLLNYDISGFNPKAPAPMTDAKQQMANDNRSDLECWLADLFASKPSLILGREIATAHEIASRYASDTGNNQPSAKAIVGACKRLGAYARPSQVRLVNDKKVRVLAIDRPEYWKLQPESEWTAEMKKTFKQ